MFVTGRVSFLLLGLGQSFLVWFWVLKNPKFFPLGQKNLIGSSQKVSGSKIDQPLIYCGPKVC